MWPVRALVVTMLVIAARPANARPLHEDGAVDERACADCRPTRGSKSRRTVADAPPADGTQADGRSPEARRDEARPAGVPSDNASVDAGACVDCGPKPVSTARRAIATAAAVMPGFLLRGTGSWLVDEKPAAKKLALVAGGGLVVAALAGLLVGSSGGHPYTVPAVPLVVGGAGVFVTTWAADIFTAAGGERVCGRPRALPRYSLELGSTWQRDAFRGRLFGRAAGRIAIGRVDVAAATLLHAGGDAWLGFADARMRLVGAAATGSAIADGSKLVVRVGGRVQRDAGDRVTQRVGEIEVGGRYDLRRLDRVLHASFVEGSTGVGAVSVRYTDEVSDLAGILLARFAWGVYVPGGEISAYYDHRRDGIAGGIAAGRAAGFVGSVGAVADVAVVGPWAVRGELQFGNAWLTTLALSYRGGGS